MRRRLPRSTTRAQAGLRWRSQPGYLGLLLHRFLHFFGTSFDFANTGLSVHSGGFLFRLPKRNSHFSKTDKLVIDDPVFPGNNVAGPTYRLELVVDAMQDAYMALRRFRPTAFCPTPLCWLLRPQWHTNARAARRQGTDAAAEGSEGRHRHCNSRKVKTGFDGR